MFNPHTLLSLTYNFQKKRQRLRPYSNTPIRSHKKRPSTHLTENNGPDTPDADTAGSSSPIQGRRLRLTYGTGPLALSTEPEAAPNPPKTGTKDPDIIDIDDLESDSEVIPVCTVYYSLNANLTIMYLPSCPLVQPVKPVNNTAQAPNDWLPHSETKLSDLNERATALSSKVHSRLPLPVQTSENKVEIEGAAIQDRILALSLCRLIKEFQLLLGGRDEVVHLNQYARTLDKYVMSQPMLNPSQDVSKENVASNKYLLVLELEHLVQSYRELAGNIVETSRAAGGKGKGRAA